MYYTKMRWHMMGLTAAYFYTLGYGLSQLGLIQTPALPLWLMAAGAVLGGLGVVLSRGLGTLSKAAVVWAWVNVALLQLLLFFYAPDTSKYLN